MGDFLEQVHKQVQANPDIQISLLFGPEDSGLSNQDLSFCQYTVALPTAQNASLNLSQAVNVFGSHLLHYFRSEAAKAKSGNHYYNDTAKGNISKDLSFHHGTVFGYPR